MSRPHIGIAAVCLLALGALGCHRDVDRQATREIGALVAARQAPAFVRGVRWSLMQQVYSDRKDRPIWVRGGHPRGKARELVRAICRSGEEGLRPADYDLAGLKTALLALQEAKRPAPADLAALDLRLTAIMLGFGTDLLSGRLDPRAVDDGWYLTTRRSSVDSTLRAALQDDDSPDVLEKLRPKQKEYDELVDALKEYQQILRNGGWGTVPPGPSLKRGDRGARVAAVRHRLHATGDLSSGRDADVFDEAVAGAVARFRVRHGLPADSVADTPTVGAMNVPVEARIKQIEVNLDRYRWLPAEFTKRYVLVNIPDFRLYAYDGGKPTFEQRVIVGDQYQSATPVFADSMTYVVFRPEWNVPARILVQEILPHLQDDERYDLASRGLEVVDSAGRVVKDPSQVDWGAVDTADLHYRIRQKPGPNNALGRVKFMFPNRFNIYLHDTPSRKLFDREQRTLSHGCVRVENPVQLAEFVLDGQQGWNQDRIEAALDDSATGNRMVSLEKPLPVYLLYLTAFVQDGQVQFRNDPYGKDRRAMARLQAPEAGPPSVCGEVQRLLGG
ncbi:MAG: L,D-transpeptidase family protein [Gemmatimonadales bacterium]